MKFIILSVITCLFAIILLNGCSHSGKNETKISKNNGHESHNAGKNCMNFHKSGGEGEGWFSVGGTVYDSLLTSIKPNGIVNLYSQPNGAGNLVAKVEVDAKGNFYTTQSVNFTAPVYPSVTNANGKQKFMSGSITTGACNNCHGVSQARIWVED
jgi:hypothetical protein